jgi:methionine-rich copper-binding protein CopC
MDRSCIAILFTSLLLPATLSAHASLLKSIPARRAHLFNAPSKVELWFSERLEARFSHLTVTDAHDRRVDLGNTEIPPDDPKRMSIGVGPLQPGLYKVRFRVLSVDGHVVEDEFSFTIRAGRPAS